MEGGTVRGLFYVTLNSRAFTTLKPGSRKTASNVSSLNYILVVYRFGEHLLTNGWGGHSIPTASFYKTGEHYLWIQFTTNGGNGDGRFHKGWKGSYQKYWPYVTSKKKKRSLRETPDA